MRFEHILQVYWSKGLFFGGKLIHVARLDYNNFFNKNLLYGLKKKFKVVLNKRLELTTFSLIKSKIFYINTYVKIFYKIIFKTLNTVFSQINNVNSTVSELKTLNILRKYLIKSYQGYCHVLGKPVRGQRTWSNSWNSFKCNNVIRNFITKVKKLGILKDTKFEKINYRNIKKKYTIKSSQNKLSSKPIKSKNQNFLSKKVRNT
jgi:ribosomal protein S13